MSKKVISVIFGFIIIISSFFSTGTNAEEGGLDLKAPSAILIEADSGKVLYEKNPDERLAPASVTKVMTLLLICEAIDSGKISLTDVVTASERAKSMGGSTIYLDTGEQMSVADLIKGICVASGNDASVAMAEYVCGSEEGFVSMMNSRAAELNMTNTHFENATGLDSDNHYSSARDISIMSRELLKHKLIFDYTGIWMDSLREGRFQLSNTNKLIRYYEGANGLKTGSTSKAGCCLSGAAKRDGMQLICVVLKAPSSKDRFSDASKLLNYGFANYGVVRPYSNGDFLGEIPVKKGKSDFVSGVCKDDISCLVAKGKTDIKTEVVLNEFLTAPVKKGDTVGYISIKREDGSEETCDITASNDVDAQSFFGYVKKAFDMITSLAL